MSPGNKKKNVTYLRSSHLDKTVKTAAYEKLKNAVHKKHIYIIIKQKHISIYKNTNFDCTWCNINV